jgi:hypothetical protein
MRKPTISITTRRDSVKVGHAKHAEYTKAFDELYLCGLEIATPCPFVLCLYHLSSRRGSRLWDKDYFGMA